MTIRRKVKQAIDRDTLKLVRKIYGTNYVRLANVNAPEKGQRGGISSGLAKQAQQLERQTGIYTQLRQQQEQQRQQQTQITEKSMIETIRTIIW